MGHNTRYQLTWHIEDEQEQVHRLELGETVLSEEVDETGTRTLKLIEHGFWRFQVVPDNEKSTVDIKDLECTIDKERFSSELARMREFIWQQVQGTFPQFFAEGDSEG